MLDFFLEKKKHLALILIDFPILIDLHLSITNAFVSSKIYDKRDDFDFDIENFHFLDGAIPLMGCIFLNL